MKHILLILLTIPGAAFAQAPAVGTISDPVPFATFTGTTPTDSGLAAHDGKIVLLMYYTPW